MLLPAESQPSWTTEFTTTDGPKPARVSLITEDIKRYIFSQEWPSGLNIRLREKVDHILLVLFRDQMITFDGEDLQQIANVVNRTLAKLRNDGVPIFFHVEASKEDESA